MCRLAAHAGRPLPLSALLYDPPRSLQEQAIEPREQHSGRLNVDGTAVAWFDPGDARPLLYRTDKPSWADPNLLGLAPRLHSHQIVAAVRSATPGMPHGVPFVHPFVVDGLAGTHNGFVADFGSVAAAPLLAQVAERSIRHLPGLTDSAILFLLALDAHRAGATPLQAARQATDRAIKACLAVDTSATLTLVLADHTGIAAVNAATGRPANSLYARPHADGGGVLASEPLDDLDGWMPVGEGAAVTLTPTTCEIHP